MIQDLSLRRSAQAALFTTGQYRRLLNVFFTYVSLLTFLYCLLTARYYRSWTLSEWLINYEGGFVRRGLVGEVAFGLGALLHLSPATIAVMIYLGAYAIILSLGRALAMQTRPTWWCLALVLSPATFSYQLLDVTGGSRKEVLYFASLFIFVKLLQRRRMVGVLTSISLSLITAFLVLSHEPLLCYLPYFFAALLLAGRSVTAAAKEFLLPALVAITAAFFCTQHLGNAETAARICTSLGYTLRAQGKEICSGGAIGFLTMTPELARHQTWTRAWGDLYLLVYPVESLIALIPIVWGCRILASEGFGREMKLLWKTAGVSFVLSLALFVYAEDWGRWVYLHIFSLGILLMSFGAQAISRTHREEASLAPWKQRRSSLLWLLAYATLWSLPHVPSRTPPFGYLGLLHYVSLYI